MKKTPAKGHTKKHTGTKKHHHTAKHHPVHHRGGATAHGHHVHAVAKHPKHAKARGLALADGVSCCAAQALAASLRLAGGRVDDDDVLALHEVTACCHDAGASILATLEAASGTGLAGWRPAAFAPAARGAYQALGRGLAGRTRERSCRDDDQHPWPGECDLNVQHALILGVDLPGPHAVLATPAGWWSWGTLYDPATWPDAVIEEAWAVSWT